MTAGAKECKIKKEHEIFVGGMECEATEEDPRKVCKKIGEVVEVDCIKFLLPTKIRVAFFLSLLIRSMQRKLCQK